MSESANIFIKAVNFMHMVPQGVVIGFIVSFAAVVVINSNNFNFRRISLTIISTTLIAAYAPHVAAEYIENVGLQYGATIFASWLASDVFSSFKSSAPTLSNWLVKRVEDFIKTKGDK